MTTLLSVFVLAASTFAAPSALSAPALCSSAPASVEGAIFDSGGGGVTLNSICTASCGSSPDVSCSASSCTAVNQSCPGEQGHVTCGTTTIYCPACTSVCTDGQIKTVISGPTCGCDDGMTTPRDRYQCIGGQWVYQSSFCGGPFCHG